jgi:hypothetical protein
MEKAIDDGIRYYTVKISVDEEALREARESIDEDEDFDLEQAITEEFGWLEQSGISLEDIKAAE